MNPEGNVWLLGLVEGRFAKYESFITDIEMFTLFKNEIYIPLLNAI